MRRLTISLLVVLTAMLMGIAQAALVMELRPQDFTGTQWPIYQGTLKTADPTKAYFAPASGNPKLITNVAGTKHAGVGMNTWVWDQCLGLGGPIAPASITGNNPRTIEVWTYNPGITTGEETLVELSHTGGTTGQHFAFENGNNWALNGSGTADVTDWTASNRTNRWVHLVVSYSAGSAKFYVDGALKVTKNATYNVLSGDSIAIGSQRSAATTTSNSTSNLNVGVYTGYIGNVRVYDTALTQTEIIDRFNLGINGGEPVTTTYTVTGQVTTGTSGIPNAFVYFSTSSNPSANPIYVATTDASGNYSISIPEGTWYIAAAKGRYTPNPTANTQIDLAANTSGVNFTLTYVTTPTKLIDMDASVIAGSDSTPVASWTNNGTLGGVFGQDGTDASTRPVLATTLGKKCVQFDGSNDRLKLLNGSTAITAPAGLSGNSDWTIAGWYLNPSIGQTECYFGWANSSNWLGARGGFMYGSHPGDGGVMHGAGPLINANIAIIPVPTTGIWHHIAVSFDGLTEKVYVDGSTNASQTEAKNLRLAALEPFLMGAWSGNATGGSPGTWFSGSIASLTVYDQVLTDAEILALGYQQTYTISGYVKDNTGQPLTGVTVYLNTDANASSNPVLATMTDGTGKYTQQVPVGTWYLSAMKSRYTPNPAPDKLVTVTTANVTVPDFTLTPDSTVHKLIDLDASNLSTGTLNTWANTGSLGGSFAIEGTDNTTLPTVATVGGKKAVSFDGSNDRLKATFTAPAGITSGSDWTVSAMLYNPAVGGEEAYLCWASRGTADRAAEFSFGSNYSAYHVTDNMKWASTPTASTWHHIAVTYDGAVEKTYVDGVLSEQSSTRYLNIWNNQPMFLGTAYDGALAKSQWFSGSIAALQVYDEALTVSEIREIATVTISGTVTGPDGKPIPSAIVGFKSSARVSAGLAIGSTADADLYTLTDGTGRFSVPILKGPNYYVAAWKDGYTPSNDVYVLTDASNEVSLEITKEAGVNLALSKTVASGKLYASPTGLGTNSVNNAFDGNTATYFYWTTSNQRDLVIDISKSDGSAESINAVTLITSALRIYNWELWVENNAAPIVSGTRNTSANWTKVYQTTGALGGYDRTSAYGQVVDPVRIATTTARGVWIKITSSSASETRPLEVMVHSSANAASIGYFKTLADGSYVVLTGKCVTWAPRNTDGNRTTNYFYVEDMGRVSGIKVVDPSGTTDAVKVNDQVAVAGTITTDPNTLERYISSSIVPTGMASQGVEAYGTTSRSVQADPNLVGQYVNLAGKVKEIGPNCSWFTISDGTMADGVEATTKVYANGIQLPANLASVDDFIIVSGVVSREKTPDNTVKSVVLLFNYSKVTNSPANAVTFFTVSDLHYGRSGTVQDADRGTVDEMNRIPGLAYPTAIGGTVQNPSGVVGIGDLDEGENNTHFDMFSTDYGVNGECRLRYPVFEGLGNHDGRVDGAIGKRIKARTPLRRNLTAISANGNHYSWDWGGIHFVHCNMSPTDVNEASSAGDQNYALQFLKDDLQARVGSSGKPVIIFHHFGFDGFSSGWWTDNERTNYYNVIKNYNVVAIAHGHTHAAGTYKWNGIDVFQDGAAQNDPNPGGFFIFRATPTQLTVIQRVYNATSGTWGWGSSWTKPITGWTPAP